MTRKQRATLSDVASKAGVSPVTVSRAIRHPEMVSEKLRERIDNAVRSLGYIPNHLASALASHRTNIVGVIVPSLTNGVFDDYLAAIQDVFSLANIQVLVTNVRYSAEKEEKAINTLLGYHPEAMILVGVDQTENSRQMLTNAGIPVVQTLDLTDNPIDLNIGLSHDDAGFAAVEYLHRQGHESIAHLTARGDPRSQQRHAGYQRAMDAFGLSSKGLVALTPRISTVQLGRRLFAEVLDRKPKVDAVFCCNDDLALGALFECQQRGIRVPEDLAIVGFNDLEFCAASVPPLSSVGTEHIQMGKWAAENVLEIIRGSGQRPEMRQVNTGFTIHERGSSMPAHKSVPDTPEIPKNKTSATG